MAGEFLQFVSELAIAISTLVTYPVAITVIGVFGTASAFIWKYFVDTRKAPPDVSQVVAENRDIIAGLRGQLDSLKKDIERLEIGLPALENKQRSDIQGVYDRIAKLTDIIIVYLSKGGNNTD